MAIAITTLKAFTNLTADQSVYTTAESYSPTADGMLFLIVGQKHGSADQAAPYSQEVEYLLGQKFKHTIALDADLVYLEH